MSTVFSRGCGILPGVYADARMMLPFLAKTVFQAKREGWFEDTSVPVVEHERYGPLPFEPQKSNYTRTTTIATTTASAGFTVTLSVFCCCYCLLTVFTL